MYDFPNLPPEGWLSEAEARLLWETAKATSGAILEVGCYRGRSTVVLASLGRPVICVDSFAGFNDLDPDGSTTEIVFLETLKERGIKNVTLFRSKVEAWDETPHIGKIGFAHLDGDHTASGTRAQILKALACKVRAIAVHDVNDDGEGVYVKRACMEVLGQWDERVERLAVWRNLC